MLRIDRVQTIAGVTVYADDDDPFTYYVLPDTARFRIGDDGQPMLRFLQYREPRPMADGRNGGGFVFFDVELTLDDARRREVLGVLETQVSAALKDHPGTGRPSMTSPLYDEIKAKIDALPPDARWHLDDGDLVRDAPPDPADPGGGGTGGGSAAAGRVKLGMITWAEGRTLLNLESLGGDFVEKVFNPGAPSLFGRNVTPFSVELSQRGATLFAQALQGQGGVVQVVYQLKGWVKLPPVTGRAWFDAATFYEFHQHISSDDDTWSRNDYYSNERREQLLEAKCYGVELSSGAGTDKETLDRVRDSLYSTLEKVIEEKMRNAVKQEDPQGDRDAYEVDYLVTKTSIESFSYTISENSAALWSFNPGGTLPNITSMPGVVWADHASVVDLDDPFFRTKRVNVRVNADFDALPIHSVDVQLEYGSAPRRTEQLHFTGSDATQTFEVFKQGDDDDVTCSYTVNYTGSADAFHAPPRTEHGTELTINVDDSGLLVTDVKLGDLDLTQVPSATVTLRYTPAGSPTIERQYVIDADHREERLVEVIHERRGVPEYKIDYRTAEGRLLHREWQPVEGDLVQVTSPFNDFLTLSLRAAGNLETEIAEITVDVFYDDPGHHYSTRTSVVLTKDQGFADVTIPVFDPKAGTLTYAQTIRRTDGTVKQVDAAPVHATTLLVGDQVADLLTVAVAADLLDWTVLKLVRLRLHYPTDDSQDDDVLLREGGPAPTWTVKVPEDGPRAYDWSADFYLLDGTARHAAATGQDDVVLLLQLPEA